MTEVRVYGPWEKVLKIIIIPHNTGEFYELQLAVSLGYVLSYPAAFFPLANVCGCFHLQWQK